jgi:integrase
MINALSKKSNLIFTLQYHTAEQSFRGLRKRLSAKLQNPRILNVSFRSFRHFGGTMLAEYTQGNVLNYTKNAAAQKRSKHNEVNSHRHLQGRRLRDCYRNDTWNSWTRKIRRNERHPFLSQAKKVQESAVE